MKKKPKKKLRLKTEDLRVQTLDGVQLGEADGGCSNTCAYTCWGSCPGCDEYSNPCV
ncbi:MAG: hypothetical protein AAF657_16050 [Acidobacteriota bacterium]